MKRVRIDRIKLTTEMLKQDMTQTELADRSGISRATICYIKNGKSCSDETAEKIANVLGVELKSIID